METFSQIFKFFAYLLTINIQIGGYNFSLMGAIAFAVFITVTLSLIHWLLHGAD